MGLEIERKFLVKNTEFKKDSFQKKYLKQGYLNTNKERTVRIRVANQKAFITIKGKSNKSGTTRFEWEKEIAITDAEQLLLLCEDSIVEKYRYFIKNDAYIFEVDEFLGENNGLILAEIELDTEHANFNKPDWLDKEVTGEIKYYNSYISKNPFKTWV